MKESPIFTRTYDLLQWLIPATIQFPRAQRFVLAEAVQQSALKLHEQFVEAAYADEPLSVLRQADVTLTRLRSYLRLCHGLKLLSTGQYEHVARMVDEVGRLLGSWIKAEEKLTTKAQRHEGDKIPVQDAEYRLGDPRHGLGHGYTD
jgi:hypothetical protein